MSSDLSEKPHEDNTIIYLSVDIDECKAAVNPCTAPKMCVNTVGSYKCNCPAGFTSSNCEAGEEKISV